MTDRYSETSTGKDRVDAQHPTETHAPPGAPVKIDDDNRSDANDGVERPLGYFSSQAQADRNVGHPGQTAVNEAAGGPGFFSPEQQAARNTPPGATSPTPLTEGEAIAQAVDADLAADRPKHADANAARDKHPDTLRGRP